MLYKNMLLAYDGSPQAKKALAQTIQLKREDPDAKLTVLHVFSYPAIVIGEAMLNAPLNIKDELYDHAQEMMREVEAQLDGLTNAKAVLEQGIPVKVILEYARDNQSDLIIVGSRGLSGLRELVLGSVSHNIVQNAHIPVLIVK